MHISRTKVAHLTLVAVVVATTLPYSFNLVSFFHAKEACLALALLPLAITLSICGADFRDGVRSWMPLWVLWIAAWVLLPLHRLPQDRWPATIELVRIASILLCLTMCQPMINAQGGKQVVWGALMASSVLAAALAILQFGGLIPILFPAFGVSTSPVYSVFGNPDLLGGYATMALPLWIRAILRSQTSGWRFASLVAGASTVAAALVLSGSRSAWLAAIAAIPLALWGLPRCQNDSREPWKLRHFLSLALIAAVVFSCILLAPGVSLERFWSAFSDTDNGIHLRYWFYAAAICMWKDHWFIGTGPAAYAYWSPIYQGDVLWRSLEGRFLFNETHTDYLHCDPLQIAIEYGLPGVICCLWFLQRLIRRRGYEMPSLLALGLFSLLNFPLFSTPHALAAGFLAGALLADQKEFQRKQPKLNIVATVFSLLLAATTLYCSTWPSYQLRQAMDSHLANTDTALTAYENMKSKVTVLPPKAHEKYAIALIESGEYSKARHELHAALRGLDTGGIHLALGVVALQQGDKTVALKHLEECVMRWPANGLAWKLIMELTPQEQRGSVRKRAGRWLEGADAS